MNIFMKFKDLMTDTKNCIAYLKGFMMRKVLLISSPSCKSSVYKIEQWLFVAAAMIKASQ